MNRQTLLATIALAVVAIVLACSQTIDAPTPPLRVGEHPSDQLTLFPRYRTPHGLSYAAACAVTVTQFSQIPDSTYAGLEEIAGSCLTTPPAFAAYANGDTAWDPAYVPCLVTTDMPGFHRQLIAGDSATCPTIKRSWDSTEVVTHGNKWWGPTGSP